ncbi:MAG: hypothetical protein A3E87_06865 [Gammaproteobacteria bacterium RIFCSPHIGHO2_12_FULL_35_23]|nr:MAG: hypothetical protein A3E87_06865 [Gammaproteobacteria bacterium RIFCSPHIGHO2_12_FULL_35_23]
MTKIAAIQLCSTNDLNKNLQTAACLIKEAAQTGAKLAVLPEMFPLLGTDPKELLAIKENYGTGKIQDFLKEQAINNNLWIAGGTIPLSSAQSNKVFAACIIYNNLGHQVACYNKIHLFDVVISEKEFYKESTVTEPGNTLVVIDSPIGKLGIAVCYDIRFPSLFTSLLNLGAEVFAIPTAFTVKTGIAHWHTLTRARAIENLCYVVGACQFGTHANGRQTYGHSLIVEPWGQIIQEIQEPRTGIVCAEIDLAYLHKLRASLPTQKHQRITVEFPKTKN